jgi:hypothetical protein
MRRLNDRIARLEGELPPSPEEVPTVHIRTFEAETGKLLFDRVSIMGPGPTRYIDRPGVDVDYPPAGGLASDA